MSAVERSAVRAREMGVLASSDGAHPRALPTGGVRAGGGWLWSLDRATPLVSILPSGRSVCRLSVRPPTHIRAVAIRPVWCGCSGSRPCLVLGRKPHKCLTGGVGASGGWGRSVDRSTYFSAKRMHPCWRLPPPPFCGAYVRDLARRPVWCGCRSRLGSALLRGGATIAGSPAQGVQEGTIRRLVRRASH
jgi:hypothetical protein